MAISVIGSTCRPCRVNRDCHATVALVDNLRVLGDFLAQELPERGDVKANEATSTFPDDAVLEETAFSNLLQLLFSGRPTLKKKRIEQPNHLNFNQLVDK